MIHYHGCPITPDAAAVHILTGRHALVSFAYPQQIGIVADVCQSFIQDNGAYTFWKQKKAVNWPDYYEFVDTWRHHPGHDWALIPDVIDGTEDENDALIASWPFEEGTGVPVWHLGESLERLTRLVSRFRRVALGSSALYSQVGTKLWHARMAEVMGVVCLPDGRCTTKLHGLRMLNPNVFMRYPLSSADSSNVGRNIGIDTHWKTGRYLPKSKAMRGMLIASRIEHHQSAPLFIEDDSCA